MLTRGEDLETLVRRHGARLLSMARAILPEETESRNAVREAFLGVTSAAANGNAWPLLRTGLARAAARRRPAGPEHTGVRIESLLPRFDAAGRRIAPLPADGAAAGSSIADAALLIRRLPWDHRAALVLCDGGQMRPEEAAAALGEQPEVVRRRLGEAHQGLCTLVASLDRTTAAPGSSFPGPRSAAPPAPPPA